MSWAKVLDGAAAITTAARSISKARKRRMIFSSQILGIVARATGGPWFPRRSRSNRHALESWRNRGGTTPDAGRSTGAGGSCGQDYRDAPCSRLTNAYLGGY